MIKIFITRDKVVRINFVDENNVFVGYNASQNCCEAFGWFISKDEKDSPFREDWTYLYGLLDGLREEDLNDYLFDTKYYVKQVSPVDDRRAKALARFRLVAQGKEPLYLHLYNVHNGYYCHGFEFGQDGQIIEEDIL